MADETVVSQYGPTDPYWTLEHLSLGDWLPISNFRSYSEAEAVTRGITEARANNTSYRVVFHGEEGSVPVGDLIEPPTSWYVVEKDDGGWTQEGGKHYSLDAAEAVAQNLARDERLETRVRLITV